MLVAVAVMSGIIWCCWDSHVPAARPDLPRSGRGKKAELFASVMDEGNAFGAGLDADDIRGLFA